MASPSWVLGKVEDAGLDWVAKSYCVALSQSTSALAHLARRGITDAAINHFSVGYGGQLQLRRKGSRAGEAQRAQLRRLGVLAYGRECMKGCIVVPLHDKRGQVVQMYGRQLRRQRRQLTPHRFLELPAAGVFNREGITGTNHVILCATPLRAAAFWSAGLVHATSSYAGGFTDELRRALTRRHIKRVTLAFGAEEQEDVERIAREFRGYRLSVYVAADDTPGAVSAAVWQCGPR